MNKSKLLKKLEKVERKLETRQENLQREIDKLSLKLAKEHRKLWETIEANDGWI